MSLSFTDTQLNLWLTGFVWPLFRIGALVMAAPILNTRQIPVMFRVGLVLVLTWLVVPVLPGPPLVDLFSSDGFLMLLQQLLIGVMMGFLLQMVFGALVFGGQVIAYSMGLGFASMMDPQNGVQVPVVAQFYMIFATLLFLVIDGHLILIDLLVQSFHTFPVAADGISRNGLMDLLGWGSRMFSGGMVMALPVMAALLLVNLGMGIVTRAAPQLNIFAVGFPITMLMGFVLVWATLPIVLDNFQDLLAEAFAFLRLQLGMTG